jgi:hypothetical protein
MFCIDFNASIYKSKLKLNQVYILKHDYTLTINRADHNVPVVIKRLNKYFMTLIKPEFKEFNKSTSTHEGKQLIPPISTYRSRWALFTAEPKIAYKPSSILLDGLSSNIGAGESLIHTEYKDEYSIGESTKVVTLGLNGREFLVYTVSGLPSEEASLADIFQCFRWCIK